jgi:PIN domain nuclease of toxin-antitoxin system
VKLLLDTHVALWLLANDPRLSPRAKTLVLDPATDPCVSAATIWEIAIKHALNRGAPNDMPISARDSLTAFAGAGFSLIAVLPAHAAAVAELPRLHADPFDRLLVAQARAEGMTLMTHDSSMAAYDPAIILI